jgi:hypothetical protein
MIGDWLNGDHTKSVHPQALLGIFGDGLLHVVCQLCDVIWKKLVYNINCLILTTHDIILYWGSILPLANLSLNVLEGNIVTMTCLNFCKNWAKIMSVINDFC